MFEDVRESGESHLVAATLLPIAAYICLFEPVRKFRDGVAICLAVYIFTTYFILLYILSIISCHFDFLNIF